MEDARFKADQSDYMSAVTWLTTMLLEGLINTVCCTSTSTSVAYDGSGQASSYHACDGYTLTVAPATSTANPFRISYDSLTGSVLD